MVAEDADGRNAAAFRRRCVGVARCVVALAMTGVILAVLAHAIRVVLRSQDLFLQLDKSFVAMEVEHSNLGPNLTFALDLQAANPSGRVAIYFEDILAYLYGAVDNASQPQYFLAAPIKDISLKQQSREFQSMHWYRDDELDDPNLKPYFDLFNSSGNKGIPAGIVVVNGTLTIGLNSWHNRTPTAATYYCWPVTIGGDSSENTAGDALCTDSPPTVMAYIDFKSFVL